MQRFDVADRHPCDISLELAMERNRFGGHMVDLVACMDGPESHACAVAAGKIAGTVALFGVGERLLGQCRRIAAGREGSDLASPSAAAWAKRQVHCCVLPRLIGVDGQLSYLAARRAAAGGDAAQTARPAAFIEMVTGASKGYLDCLPAHRQERPGNLE